MSIGPVTLFFQHNFQGSQHHYNSRPPPPQVIVIREQERRTQRHSSVSACNIESQILAYSILVYFCVTHLIVCKVFTCSDHMVHRVRTGHRACRVHRMHRVRRVYTWHTGHAQNAGYIGYTGHISASISDNILVSTLMKHFKTRI